MCIAGLVSTLAGSGDWAFADGLGILAKFRGPKGLWLALNGDVWVADTSNNRIRVISSSGSFFCFALLVIAFFIKINGKLVCRVCEYACWLWNRWLC